MLDDGGRIEEGFDAGEEGGQAVGLGDNGSDAEGGREGFTEDVIKHGVKDDRGCGHSGVEQGGGLDAVHGGHGEIENDEVGAEGASLVEGFGAVDGFAADLEVGLKIEKSAEGMSYGGFVFDDEDAFRHGRWGT